MITKVYEITCDNCGYGLNHYIGNKPTNIEMKNDGLNIIKDKQYCDECYKKIKETLNNS